MNISPEATFDSMVELAAHICKAPVATLNLFDHDRSNLIASTGLDFCNVSGSESFFAYIKQKKEIVVMTDALSNSGFSSSPLTIESPDIRFLAGIPLISNENHCLGALCIFDTVSRELDSFQLKALNTLAKQLTSMLSMQFALKSLEHEKKKYAALLQISGDGVHIFDRKGNVVDINDKFCEMLGYSRQELLTMNVADWDAGFSPDALKDKVQQTFNTPEIFDTKHRRKDGTIIDVEISAQPVWIDNQLYLWNASRDITERKQSEAEREHLLRIIGESTDFIGTTDTQGRVKYINKAGCRIIGLAENTDVSDLEIKDIHPKWASKIVLEQGIPYSIQHGHWVGETALLNIAGHEIPVSQVILAHRNEHSEPQLFSTIMRDISTSKIHEKALLEAKEAAETANRAKTIFLTNISHELRTPLNAILGFAQLLKIDSKLDGQCKQQVMKIEQAGRLLFELVNELIDLGRIESGKLQFNMENIPINSLANDSIKIVESMAKQQGIKITYQSEVNETTTVRADSSRLRQVLINLLSNAIKYNRAQGSVTLICQTRADKIRINVIDTGIGIPFNMRKRIFTNFDRLGKEGGKIEGVGIGLSISKNITEAMGGSIGFDSIEGMGSSFWLEFPAGAPVKDLSSDTGPSPSQAIRRPSSEPKRILLVEDNSINQMLACAILNKIGYAVDIAEDGAKAVEAVRAQTYDLVLMDCLMPVMDGYEATKAIRRDEANSGKHIPIVAMTANAMEGDREVCLAAGMDDYLTKPIDILKLEKIVNHWLQHQ